LQERLGEGTFSIYRLAGLCVDGLTMLFTAPFNEYTSKNWEEACTKENDFLETSNHYFETIDYCRNAINYLKWARLIFAILFGYLIV
jgi:hypothetical protein